MTELKPPGWHTVTPRIIIQDVSGLVRFLEVVFDGQGTLRSGAPAEIKIGDSIILISDGDGIRKTTTAFLYVYVEDTDKTYARAISAGAESIESPINMPYGDRRATFLDKWGNLWQIATRQTTPV